MKSLVKLLAFVLVTILIPSLVMGLISIFNGGETVVLIGQLVIMLLMVLSFVGIFSKIRKYELRTKDLIKNTKGGKDLRRLREERITHKSKAAITKSLLALDYKKEDLDLLRKYTNSTEDMKSYYAALIANSQGREREEAKIKRDNFFKKYQNRTRIYPDFRENVRVTIKWLLAFFILVIGLSLFKRKLEISSGTSFALYGLGLFLSLILMINTILWISRSLASYWDRKYI